MNDLASIGDTLIDIEAVRRNQERHMNDSFESYSRATILLGYFSQLRDYNSEYGHLMESVLHHRKEFIDQYKQQMLVAPDKTEWYTQGINKYKKVQNYTMYYYRRQLYIRLEEATINIKTLKRIIDTVITLDKYYDIYDETIGFFMRTSAKFEDIMRQQFSDRIHL
jgi:hypothetical protein